jgi:hypothetical protein
MGIFFHASHLYLSGLGERMTFMTPQAIVDTLRINTVPFGIDLLREESDKDALE